MHRGYVKVWRKIQDSGLMQMPNTLALFMHILFNATHKDIKVGTTTGVVKLLRGQYISGRIKLASDLKQSQQQIRTSLQRLTDLDILSAKTTNRYTIYTIENYSLYQDINQQDNQQTTNKQPTDNQQITTKQEHKHINTEEESRRATRLSPDWQAPQNYIDYCKTNRPDLNANDVADMFKNHWLSQPDSKARKVDWFATWRNWVKREKQNKKVSKFKNRSDFVSDEDFSNWLNSENGKVAQIHG